MSPVNSTDGRQNFFDSIDRHGKPVASYEELAKIEAVEDAVATAQLRQSMAQSTGFITAVELLAMRSILQPEAIAIANDN
jgi:hypothetical protein